LLVASYPCFSRGNTMLRGGLHEVILGFRGQRGDNTFGVGGDPAHVRPKAKIWRTLLHRNGKNAAPPADDQVPWNQIRLTGCERHPR
jgi:hypothetical protein